MWAGIAMAAVKTHTYWLSPMRGVPKEESAVTRFRIAVKEVMVSHA